MIVEFDTSKVEDYLRFLEVKRLPQFKITGRTAWFPDEYAARLGLAPDLVTDLEYWPAAYLFDYQRDIAKLAIKRKKFGVFLRCGYGKTGIIFEYARHAQAAVGPNKRVLIVSPLMVIAQTIAEAKRFYGGDIKIEKVAAKDLKAWVHGTGDTIGITNYEAITDEIEQGNIGCLILDESSLLKSAYGKWGLRLIEIGKGLEWKLALTGTPAPNDRIEFANHAVFLDAFPTVNSFLAKFFVNRGQTDNRWEIKPHAVMPFYKALSHWSIFVSNPGNFGWKDNAQSVPPVHVHIHEVELTASQRQDIRAVTGDLFVSELGGIVSRSKIARIAKGGDSLKPQFILDLLKSWPGESCLLWCRFNPEQDGLAKIVPNCGSIDGPTPMPKREAIIEDFKAKRIDNLISKAKVIGFGLNLQVATRQIFSSLHDSYEEFTQAVARSNRVGSTVDLNVHVPVTEAELPMVQNVLRKAHRIEADNEIQEEMFRNAQV